MANQPPTDLKLSPPQKPASMATYKRMLRKEIKKRALEPEGPDTFSASSSRNSETGRPSVSRS